MWWVGRYTQVTQQSHAETEMESPVHNGTRTRIQNNLHGSIRIHTNIHSIFIYNKQARPSATLAPCCVSKWTMQANHHPFGDCSWVTLPGYSADLVCTDVGHLHAHTHIASYTYTMLKELLGHVFLRGHIHTLRGVPHEYMLEEMLHNT